MSPPIKYKIHLNNMPITHSMTSSFSCPVTPVNTCWEHEINSESVSFSFPRHILPWWIFCPPEIETFLNYHFLLILRMASGPDNCHFNQDTFQVPTRWQAINPIYSEILTDKSIFSSIVETATLGGVKDEERL